MIDIYFGRVDLPFDIFRNSECHRTRFSGSSPWLGHVSKLLPIGAIVARYVAGD